MKWGLAILLAIAVVVLPFLFRRAPEVGDWSPGDPELIIVTPHNEAIRHEFGEGFSRWHQARSIGVKPNNSSRLSVCLAKGAMPTGTGCVAALLSPGTSLFGAGCSRIGHRGAPVSRSNTNSQPILVCSNAAGIVLPSWRI